jgi:hypothetical protein
MFTVVVEDVTALNATCTSEALQDAAFIVCALVARERPNSKTNESKRRPIVPLIIDLVPPQDCLFRLLGMHDTPKERARYTVLLASFGTARRVALSEEARLLNSRLLSKFADAGGSRVVSYGNSAGGRVVLSMYSELFWVLR